MGFAERKPAMLILDYPGDKRVRDVMGGGK